MLRWLKERKKQHKKQKGCSADDYGFKKSHDPNYGFEEKIYHIYEEIPDLPLPLKSKNIAVDDIDLDSLSPVSVRRLPHKDEGPYMVVPIVGSSSTDDLDSAVDLLDSADELLDCHEGRTAFTCAVIGRRRSFDHGSLSLSSEPYDFSTSGSSEGQGSISGHDLASLDSYLQRSSHIPLEPRIIHKNKCNTSSSSSTGIPGRSKISPDSCSGDSNDTCYEYDVSTSSESDLYNYEYYLSRVEENLKLKHDVQQLIMDMDRKRRPQRRSQRKSAENEENDSDIDSLTTVSSLSQSSGHKSRKALSNRVVDYDEGTLGDQSESENSSGYYESFSPQNTIERKCPRENSRSKSRGHSSNRRTAAEGQKQQHQSRERRPHSQEHTLKAKHPKSTHNRSVYKKPKHQRDGGSKGVPSGGVFDMIASESREVYSPPPSVSDFATRHAPVPSKTASKPRKLESVEIYKSKAASQNRLLSDLIILNYDRQLMIRV